MKTFGNQARVDESSEAAFRWLDSHARSNDIVVNEPNVDGSLWMYTQHGVKPLLGLRLVGSLPSQSASNDWDNRSYLVQHIQDLGEDPRIEQLVSEYGARWIYYDARTFPLATHVLNVDKLRRNPRIREVLRHDTVHVFEISVA